MQLSTAFAAAILDCCPWSNQEGDLGNWSNELRGLSRDKVQQLMAATAPTPTPIPETEHGIFKGLSRDEIIRLNAAAYRERRRLRDPVDPASVEFEIWSSDAEGAYSVAETNNAPVPKTLAKAMRSPLCSMADHQGRHGGGSSGEIS